MEFEWDESKNQKNTRERGIGFVYAVRIFAGPIFQQKDTRKDYGEIRIKAIGKIDDTVLCVVFTMRGEKRRIISARKASRRERQEYDTNQAGT